ncbi:hypothetical protein J7M07_04385 [bacterium]|nr:hypothetical protein [bacterium]
MPDDGKHVWIEIKEVAEKEGKNGIYYSVKGTDGRTYNHFPNEEDGNWSNNLKAGKKVYVYLTEKENPRNKKYPFRNIYPPREKPASRSSAESTSLQAADRGSAWGQFDGDKSQQIRWMNALNNASHLCSARTKRN